MNQTAACQPRILIVDDDRMTRAFLRDAVTECGYLAEEAATGAEALRKVGVFAPDAVLLDIILPDMDGFKICETIRSLPQGAQLPIVMTTALESAENINRAYAVGATDYLPKPINPSLLRHHLRYVLRASRMFEELQHKDERLQLISQVFEHSSEMILVADASYRIVEVNSAFCRLSGYQRTELVGQDMCSHPATRDEEAFLGRLWETLEENGRWQGELLPRRKSGECFPALVTINAVTDPSGAVSSYVVIYRDISRLRETEQRLIHLSQHDSLTELPNRFLFLDRVAQALKQAMRRGGLVGVLYLDLDNFHEFNNSLGHAAGDRLLRMVANRLAARIRDSDSMARFGGDEFAFLLHDITRDECLALVARRFQEELRKPFVLDGREYDLSASIGMSIYPGDGGEAEDLCKQAELAMKTAKRNGKNRYCFFSPEMNNRANEQLALKLDLRRGLERHEFLLHYQAKFDCRSGAFTGLEALVRWQHPRLGLLPPAKFIPLAEESGLIIPLGEQILWLACRQNRAWRDKGYQPFRMAVNLSARQFRDDQLLDTVSRVLEETGLSADGLELEITESAFMEETSQAIDTLNRLRDMNIRIALDDFGSGYSSLSYLKRFPVDTLKIDFSFIKNMFEVAEDRAIVKAIISMARSLQLRTVAEGVETEQQRTFLLAEGCDELQGYVAGMPLPAEQIERFLVKGRPQTGMPVLEICHG